MITFKITFILAFSLKPKSEVKKKEKENPKGKNRKFQNGVKENKKTIKNKKDEVEISLENPKYMFEIDKIVGVAHVEYELIPNKTKYQIDVKCWGPIAKVNKLMQFSNKRSWKFILFADIHQR